ncbi:hypothetical protein RB195_009612 [Necator americanus]|uniref:DNA polymerase kappa n=1 Tax=Necator americanus TaxID=51031 RepID=A0ABR1CUM0_NECAM
MSGLDKERITRIIESNTSENFSNFSKKQQQRIDEKTAVIKKRLEAATPAEWARAEKEMDEMVAKLECTRDLQRDCVHIDMDAYFAAVEMRDDPRLRTVPMAVGSMAMLSTSNYIARRFGVRAAMPGFIAKKLCPQLEIVDIFEAIFAEYDEDLSMGSLDEAYLDLTAYVAARSEPRTFTRRQYGGECICRLPLIVEEVASTSSVEMCKNCGKERKVYEDDVEFGTSRAEIVREIRFRVEQATGLTCSAGIAPCFKLAKICSDMNKPNGQYELENTYESIMAFLHPLPIRKVSGIGRVSEALLRACGVQTVGDLMERRVALKFSFSPLCVESFMRIALGLPGRPSASDPHRKSISVERTFTPTSDRDVLLEVMEEVCSNLLKHMPKAGIAGGRCVTLKLKLSSFDVLTRSISPGRLVSTREDILSVAREALDRELPNEIRLLGIRLSNLQFTYDRPADTPVSILDFWKKRQEIDVAANEDNEANSESASDLSNIVLCPICNVPLKNDDRVVNQHLDECLNSAVLVDSPRPNEVVKPTRKRKGTIETYFAKKDRK